MTTKGTEKGKETVDNNPVDTTNDSESTKTPDTTGTDNTTNDTTDPNSTKSYSKEGDSSYAAILQAIKDQGEALKSILNPTPKAKEELSNLGIEGKESKESESKEDKQPESKEGKEDRDTKEALAKYDKAIRDLAIKTAKVPTELLVLVPKSSEDAIEFLNSKEYTTLVEKLTYKPEKSDNEPETKSKPKGESKSPEDKKKPLSQYTQADYDKIFGGINFTL
jgi:hypothetical protein